MKVNSMNKNIDLKKARAILNKFVVDKKLNQRQAGFVLDKVKGENSTKAVMTNYNNTNEDYCAVQGSRLISNDRVKEGFIAVLEKAGATNEKVATRIDEGLDAIRIQTSPTEQDKLLPDYNARHKYITTFLQVKGLQDNTTNTINQNILMNRPFIQMPFDKLKEEARKLLLEDTEKI